MNLKFHDDRGNELFVTDLASFIDFIQGGKIRPETLVYDQETSLWKRADDYEQYRAALVEMSARRVRQADVPIYGAPNQSELLYTGAVEFRKRSPWLAALAAGLILFALTVLIISSVAFSSGAEAIGFRIGTAFGYSIWIALAAFLIWRFALGKRRGAGLMIFAIGFFVICCYQSLSAFVEAQNSRKAIDDVALLMQDAMSGKPIDPKTLEARNYGQTTPMVRVIADYAAQTQSDFENMNQEMETLAIDQLLTRETLEDSTHIDAGQRRLQSLLEVFDRYEALFRQRTEEMPARVEQTKMSSRDKREFLAGFDSSKNAGIQRISEFFDIERSFLGKTDEIYNFMRGKRGRYHFIGSQIQFNSQSDADTYNGLLDQINAIAQQENDWKTQTSRAGEEEIEKMRRKAAPRF